MPKPKPCTVTSPEGNESKIISCSEVPVAVQLQGNKDQSKKMAAMTTIDNHSVRDTSADEEKQKLPITEKGKTKEVNDARVLKAQIGLKEQQLEYKQRKEREYQTQMHRTSRQLTLHSRPVHDSDSFHSTDPELAGIWNYERNDISPKSRGHRIFFEPYGRTEEDDDVQSDASSDYSRAFESRECNYTVLVGHTEKSSTKTVRVGPGYSVLALPNPPRSSAETSESRSTWAEVSSMILYVILHNNG
jgi:hypothetical protein